MAGVSGDPLERLLAMKLVEKFEEFFKEAETQQAIAAVGVATFELGISSFDARLLMRELLMNAHVSGAEALLEMLREGEEKKTQPN